MICFPLDNTEYEAIALGAWLGTRTRGVFSADTNFAVTANGDMSVTLTSGLAWLKADTLWGVVMHEINATNMPIEMPDGSLTRFAAVCLRLDKNMNIGLPVIKYGPYGTNSTIDSLPPPEQNSLDFDEIYVAAIQIRAGATEILPSDIIDLRHNEFYCGLMRDGVTGIPTQVLYDAWFSFFNTLRDESLDVFNAYQEKMREFYNISVTDFNDWFESIKDILDEEVAGNLLLHIQELQARVPSAVIGIIEHGFNHYPSCELYCVDYAVGTQLAGDGGAGGGNLVTVPAEYELDGFDSVSVKTIQRFAEHTEIHKINARQFAFMKPGDLTSLLLIIR